MAFLMERKSCKLGTEFLVNTQTANDQYEPTITSLTNGGFVVSWWDVSGTLGDTSGASIKAQVFTAAGARVGSEFLVNTERADVQYEPTITGLKNGGFVVSWSDFSGSLGDDSGSSIKAQVFTAAGARIGSEIRVNTQTADDQDEPTITSLTNGGFVVSWTDFSGTPGDASGSSIKAQVFTAAGARVGSEILVNTETADDQYEPTITGLTNGGFVVSWTDFSGTPGGDSGSSIKAQVFTAAGARVGSEILVNTETTDDHDEPTITGLTNGGFVVSWTDFSGTPGDDSGSSIKAQVFTAAGARVGNEILVNTETAADQYEPTITGLPNGGFVVSWSDDSGTLGDASRTSIKAQVFSAAGARVGSEILVNTETADDQYEPTITGLPNGGFVVSWTDFSGSPGDASGSSIKAQLDFPGYVISGTAGNDVISPTRAPAGQPRPGAGCDLIYGLAGNDQLDGGAGADTMFGGAGNDTYYVENVSDVVREDSVAGVDDGGIDTVSSSVSWTLGAFVENLTLTGTAAINGTGNALANRITGNAAANVLDGGNGNDTISGGVGADTLIGGEGDDALSGGDDSDRLLGGAGNDRLDGGTGADVLMGGAGNDSYTVDNIGDLVDETDGFGNDAGGIDTVSSSVSWTLGAFVENLTLTGTAAINGTGNALANRITGNAAANVLDGLAGNDTLTGNVGADTLIGGEGDDALSGGDGSDSILGGAGNDRLNGGAGADVLMGGAGNDSYTVDNIGDLVDETDGFGNDAGGIDTVSSSVSWTLGAFVENLTLTGTAAINGTGNALVNRITGNAAANVLDGGNGNDTISGGVGADTLIGGEGDDALSGGDDSDRLLGGAGNDRLDGGAGADTLIGGAGNDSYTVDNLGDVVDETNGVGGDAGGVDTVTSSVTFNLTGLAAFVENLTLSGTAAINGTGNALANRITGNTAANVLDGGGSNDTLSGGAGADRLLGGAGLDSLTGGADADTFVFTSVFDGRDTITDFVSGVDRLEFDDAGFSSLIAGGPVSLAINSSLASGFAGFTFNTGTKVLSFDSDGLGGAAATEIARLSTTATLSANDFWVV
jgi:serralysin